MMQQGNSKLSLWVIKERPWLAVSVEDLTVCTLAPKFQSLNNYYSFRKEPILSEERVR
jgi:hypothetical protein